MPGTKRIPRSTGASGAAAARVEAAQRPDPALREKSAAEADAALEGAEDADDLVGAFKQAPPSVKAMHHDTVEGKSGELAAEEQASFEDEMPDFQAEMSGTDDLAAPEAVATPENREAVLEEGAPPPLIEPEVDPTPDPGTADLNRSGDDLIAGLFQPGEAAGLGRAFNRVQTGDTDVDTSAGERPDVPQEGATDPARVTDQDTAAREDATATRQEATQAVLDGPGPEQVELQGLSEEFAMEARAAPEIAEAEGSVEGAEEFRTKELDPEVVALFDQHHSDAMSESLGAAEEDVSAAVEARDTDRDTEVADAESERDRLNAEADENQRTEVTDRRQDVQDARQTAVDAQADHVADMEADADTRRQEAQDEIDGEIADTERQIETDFDQAEDDAEAEVRAGEADAEAERDRQEREAENQSWWDRATDWVADQFNKLTEFINDVFDAVRSAVSDIIDAVKDAALALIDLAASAITAAIEAFGEALRSAVNALLAEHFPEVAQALNDAIDSAVEVATAAVDAIAEGLKAAVSAMLDALAAGLDAILAAYQAAVNAALAIMRAALTGDWSELARLILEPILMALGIQPEAFYEMIAQATEALGIIIDDPVGFLSNLVDAFVGGVRKFAGNLLTHLQAGIIGWLTGALGGDIQIPSEWNLMSVLELARQILGLTVDMLRRVAVRVLGEEAVERIEFFMGYAVELITGGFTALWEKIVQDLGNLKDMVLDAIKTFLLERIVMAAITWLASLFSPVGALIKLVMTIWNFMMFLKDQLARIIQVVQTVVSTIYEIATGVLEPAMQGVENVLARLLPIAIDLLARLLGLGNVAGRVRRIIGDVRQRIEDALVRLINRVLSAFTGGRMGGGGAEDDEAEGEGEIMAPVPVSGGGETHTLYIEDQGETVRPMIRSTPTPLATWLDQRMAAPLDELAERNGWDAEEKGRQGGVLQGLINRAKEEERQLDTQAEQAEDAISGGEPDAEAEKSDVQDEAQETKTALEEVLDFFGISNPPIEVTFSAEIAALHPAIRTSFNSDVLPWMQQNAEALRELPWTQVVDRAVSEALGHNRWSQPGLKPSLMRTGLAGDFLTAMAAACVGAAEERITGAGEEQGASAPFASDPQLDEFFHRYLANDLNQPASAIKIQKRLLGTGSGIGPALVSLLDAEINAAVGRLYGRPRADFSVSSKVDQGNFQSVMVDAAKDPNATFGPYFEYDEDNIAGSNPTSEETLLYFLQTSRRQARNRQEFADAIRDISPGHHEWIPGNLVSRVIEVTSQRMESIGETESVKGAFALIRFQHEVRTPTSDLMFKPGSALPNLDRNVSYLAPQHYQALQEGVEPTSAQLTDYYAGLPAENTPVPVIQAHSGGLSAYQRAGSTLSRARLEAPSTDWHNLLRERIAQPLSDFAMSNAELDQWREPIIGFVDETIWRGAVPIAATTGGAHFDLYYVTHPGTVMTYDQLQSHAQQAYQTTLDNLNADMETVLS